MQGPAALDMSTRSKAGNNSIHRYFAKAGRAVFDGANEVSGPLRVIGGRDGSDQAAAGLPNRMLTMLCEPDMVS